MQGRDSRRPRVRHGLRALQCEFPGNMLTPMSQTESQLAAFREVAEEISEALGEKSHKVDVAMSIDEDFVSGQARSGLLRDIVLAAASSAASRGGVLDFRPVNGSGRELRLLVGLADRRYRIRGATRIGKDLRIRANSDSALTRTDPDESSLIPEEQWVLAWSTDSDDHLDDVFIAQVVGVTETVPHWLVLDAQTSLLMPRATPPNKGFTPTDDALPGFGDYEEGDLGSGAHS
jgi:hypothetical protein